MSKFYKRTGVLLGICLAIGVILISVGIVMGASVTVVISKEDGVKIVDDSYRWNHKDMEVAPFDNIYIQVNDANVNIVPSTDGKYGIEFSMLGDSSAIDFVNEGGFLVIGDKVPDSYFSINLNPFNINSDNYVTIYVPEDASFQTIRATGKTCDVNIESIKMTKNIELITDVGDIDVDKMTCESMYILTDVGDVDLDNVNIGNSLTVYTDVGDFDFDGIIKGHIEMEVDVGDVDIVAEGNESDYKYNLAVDAGGIDAFGHKSSFLEGKVAGNNEGKYSMNINVDVGNLSISIK